MNIPYRDWEEGLWGKRLAAAAVFLFGGGVLWGWAWENPILKQFSSQGVSIKANTALAMSWAGLALWFLRSGPGLASGKPRRIGEWLGLICSGGVFAIGGLTLVEYLFQLDFGIDQILFEESVEAVNTSHPGRMGPNTALVCWLFGSALLLYGLRRGVVPAQNLVLTACLVAYLAVLGYLYDIRSFYGFAFYTHMALPTALISLVLAAGILASRVDCGFMSLFIRDDLGGVVVRRLFPAMILLPTLLGWLVLQGQRAGYYSFESGVALFAGANIVLFSLLVWWNARSLHQMNTERQRAEAELKASQQYARNLIDSSLDMIIAVDRDMRITEFNRAAQETFGYYAEEILGRSTDLLFGGAELSREIGDQVRERGHCAREVVHVRKNGERFYAFLSASNVRDALGRVVGMMGVSRDITERKQAEEQQARLAAIVESSYDAVVGKSLEGMITNWNAAAERLYGYTKAEAIGQSIRLVIPSEREEEMTRILDRIRSGTRVDPFETVRVRKDGRRLDIFLSVSPVKDAQGRVIAASSIARDVTERKQAEKQIFELNATLFSVLDALPDIVFVVNDEQELKLVNPAASRFMNATGMKEQFPDGIARLVQQVLEEGNHYLPSNFKGVQSFSLSNEDRFLLPRIVAMRNEFETVFGAVVVLHDVTEFRLLDEVKTNLIGTVSHELKTPITSVRMALLVLLEQSVGPLNAQQLELLGIARDECERLLYTLNSLLDLTRFEEGRPAMHWQPADPAELVQSAMAEVRAAAEQAGVIFRSDIENDLPSLQVDHDRILHVLTNLLTNAIKYSPSGGEVRISVRRKGDWQVYFGITDQGPGIPPDYHQQIFQKFYRRPGDKRTGVGLGLAIAREFVKAHQGEIGVKSEPPHGSEFFVILPNNPE